MFCREFFLKPDSIKKYVEFDQRRQRYQRLTGFQSGTGDGIQHPCGNQRNFSRVRLDTHELT